MSDSTLFISEILKGISTGFVKGMEMRDARALKERELALKEKSLMSDKALTEMKISTQALRDQMAAERSKAELAVKELDAQTRRLKVDQDLLKSKWEQAHGDEKAALEKQIADRDYQIKQTELELKAKDVDIKELNAKTNRLEAEIKKKAPTQVEVERVKGEERRKTEKQEQEHRMKLKKFELSQRKSKEKTKPKLPTVVASKMIQQSALPRTLMDIERQMKGVKGSFGRYEGPTKTFAARNLPFGWGEKWNKELIYEQNTEKFSDQLKTIAEGKRSSDYDSRRWLEYVPNISFPYEVAKEKLNILKRGLLYEQRITYEIYKAQGYNMDGIPVPPNITKDPLGKYGSPKQEAIKFIREIGETKDRANKGKVGSKVGFIWSRQNSNVRYKKIKEGPDSDKNTWIQISGDK